MEQLSAKWQPGAQLVGRLLMAAIFVHEGMAKLAGYAAAARYAEAFGVPAALLPPAIAIEIGCGLLIALGLFTRAAALLLAVFCVVTAALFHARFGEINQLLHFEKNLAIAGGFLLLAVAGPGPISFEGIRRKS
jgi:putative oxidoreductase